MSQKYTIIKLDVLSCTTSIIGISDDKENLLQQADEGGGHQEKSGVIIISPISPWILAIPHQIE